MLSMQGLSRKNSMVVGHVPFNLAPTLFAFLRRPANRANAEVTCSKVSRGMVFVCAANLTVTSR